MIDRSLTFQRRGNTPIRKYSMDPRLLQNYSAAATAMLAATKMASIEEGNENRSTESAADNQPSTSNIPQVSANAVIQNRPVTQQDPSTSQQRHSAFLPQSHTWTSGLPPGSSLMSSLSGGTKPSDQELGLFSYGSTGLSSPPPLPYPTLALSQLLAAGAKAAMSPATSLTSPQRVLSPPPGVLAMSPSGTLSPPLASASGDRDGAPSGQAISRALEHYSLNLLRSQLEQAQQQAQVWPPT